VVPTAFLADSMMRLVIYGAAYMHLQVPRLSKMEMEMLLVGELGAEGGYCTLVMQLTAGLEDVTVAVVTETQAPQSEISRLYLYRVPRE
jgi:hypothetical protein